MTKKYLLGEYLSISLRGVIQFDKLGLPNILVYFIVFDFVGVCCWPNIYILSIW